MNRRSTYLGRGVLLMEMLLALAVTAIAGVAIVSLLSAVAHGTSMRNDMQESFVHLRMLTSRINAAIRESGTVLAHGDDYLLLWSADFRSDGVPNLSELRLIERDAQTNQIGRYHVAFASGLNVLELTELDTALPLSTDFTALVGQLKANAWIVHTPWAHNITQWTVGLDDSTPQAASVVSYRLTLEAGQVRETALSSARLRNR